MDEKFLKSWKFASQLRQAASDLEKTGSSQFKEQVIAGELEIPANFLNDFKWTLNSGFQLAGSKEADYNFYGTPRTERSVLFMQAAHSVNSLSNSELDFRAKLRQTLSLLTEGLGDIRLSVEFGSKASSFGYENVDKETTRLELHGGESKFIKWFKTNKELNINFGGSHRDSMFAAALLNALRNDEEDAG